MSGILALWDAVVETVGVLVIVCLGLGLMMGVMEPSRAFIRLGGTLGCMVLLLELPAILMGIWTSLSFWQHVGSVTVLLGVALVALRGTTSKAGRKGSD